MYVIISKLYASVHGPFNTEEGAIEWAKHHFPTFGWYCRELRDI